MAMTSTYDTGNTSKSEVAITIAASPGVIHTIKKASASLAANATDIANTRLEIQSPAGSVLWRRTVALAEGISETFPGDGFEGVESAAVVVTLIGEDNLTGFLGVIQSS